MLHFIKHAAFAAMALSASFASAQVALNGGGATFPDPVYKAWISEYTKAHTDVKINYAAIGSGGGIKGITDATLHFAGSDAPLNKKEIEALGGADKIIEYPTVAGAVVPSYNLPGVKGEVKFTGEVLADIFLGKINKWNDPALVKLNPDAGLPDTVITPAWRTDGSGTTFVFTSYLATQSRDFKNQIGVGKQVTWKGGSGGQGNPGVANIIKNVPGAIGYVEQQYAAGNSLAYGSVENADGEFVKATPDGVSKAGEAVVASLKSPLLTADLWNQKGKGVYPIASFTYMIVYKDLHNLPDAASAQVLADYLHWTSHEGQAGVSQMSYAPISAGVQKLIEGDLASLTYKGASLKGSTK